MAAHSSRRTRTYRISAAVSTLLVIFLVLFPKGGFKLGEVPLTWGYLFLGATLPVLAVVRILGFPLRMRKGAIAVFAAIVPFLIVFLFSLLRNGVNDTGAFISDIVSFFVLPFAFLFVYPVFLRRLNAHRFAAQFKFCIFAAAAFGIFLFVWYPITGWLIEIPYVTVNAADYGLIESTKNISRGAFLKLISTYNNGNLYGAAMLIVLPLYNKLEARLGRRLLLKLALVLTLSRTVWLGLVVEQLFSISRLGLEFLVDFPRVRAKSVAKNGVVLVITAIAIVLGVSLISSSIGFLFDSQLGGRLGTVTESLQATWLPSIPIDYFTEIVYASAAVTFGIVGFLAVALIFASPLLIALADLSFLRSPLRTAAFKGLLVYAVIAGVDGAVNLIPVMALYWFAYMVFLEGWPGCTDDVAAVAVQTPVFNSAALSPSGTA